MVLSYMCSIFLLSIVFYFSSLYFSVYNLLSQLYSSVPPTPPLRLSTPFCISFSLSSLYFHLPTSSFNSPIHPFIFFHLFQIILSGECGESEVRTLEDKERKLFCRNGIDSFVMAEPRWVSWCKLILIYMTWKPNRAMSCIYTSYENLCK